MRRVQVFWNYAWGTVTQTVNGFDYREATVVCKCVSCVGSFGAFTRLATAGKDIGLAQTDALRLTETVNQAIQLSGASAGAVNAVGLADGWARGLAAAAPRSGGPGAGRDSTPDASPSATSRDPREASREVASEEATGEARPSTAAERLAAHRAGEAGAPELEALVVAGQHLGQRGLVTHDLIAQ